MALPEQIPWGLDHIVIPAILLVVGTGLGFGAGRINDWLDARIVKRAFLRAIRVELSTLQKHLDGTLKDATEERELPQKGVRKALHLGTVFQTGVYLPTREAQGCF